MNTVALLVLVGDGQSDLEGLADLLRSLECYEPRIARVILVDDARGPRDLTAGPCRGSRLPITVVRHPRLGRTAPKNGVLSSGVLTGLTSLCGVPDLDFVLKIDVDALVIAPFRERLSDFFRTHPRAGLVGCRGDTCDPAHHRYRACLQRPSPFLRAIEWLDHVPQPPFANTRELYVDPPGVAVRPDQYDKACLLRPWFERAIANGHRIDDYCQGGAYAIAGALVREMSDRHVFDTLMHWLPLSYFGEDQTMAMYCRALDRELCDLSAEGEPFGISWFGLPFSAAELASRGHALIHSLRSGPNCPEAESRAFFAARREAVTLP